MFLGLAIAVIFLILAYKKNSPAWMLVIGFISGATLAIKMGGFMALLLEGLLYSPLIVAAGILIVCCYYGIIKDKGHMFYIAGLFLALIACFRLNANIAHEHGERVSFQSGAAFPGINRNQHLCDDDKYIWICSTDIAGIPNRRTTHICIVWDMLVLLKKDKRFYFVVLASWASFFYLYFGTESFTSYVSIVVVSRYFIELSAPMTILAGVFLSETIKGYAKYLSENKILILAIIFTIFTNLPMYVLFFFKRLPSILISIYKAISAYIQKVLYAFHTINILAQCLHGTHYFRLRQLPSHNEHNQ